MPAREQCPADESLRLRVPVRDDDVVGFGDDAADPAEVLRQGDSQRVHAAGIAVAEIAVGDRGERLAHASAARPSAGNADTSGTRGTEVEPRRSWLGTRRGHCRRDRAAPAASATRGRAPCRSVEIALGGQLLVGVDGDASRNAELARQVASRGHARPGSRAPLADGMADLRPRICAASVRVPSRVTDSNTSIG